MNRSIFFVILLLVLSCISTVDAAYLVFQQGNLPLISQKVKVSINNQVAVTTLEMIFDNPHDFTIQPNIRFPIHEKASVQKFTLTDSDGQTFSGTIEESQQAEQTFEAAKAEGLMPAMAVQKQPGVFEASIGAVGPKSRATVTIEYSEILPYSRGTISYTLPYDVSKYQKANLETSSIVVEIIDQKEIVTLQSPSHDIYAEKIDAQNWRSVFEKNNYLPAGDFKLVYDVKAEAMASNFLATRPEEGRDGYFMLMLSPAEIVTAEAIANRDIVFVMDTSGSMQGTRIMQTKKAFEFFVNKLNENDRYGIVDFSSGVKQWKEELQKVDEWTKSEASHYISKLHASGGTNIHGALLKALELFDKAENRTKTVIFLTDGEATNGVTNTEQIVREFNAANVAQVRTFTLGVGRNVNKTLLNKLAIENRGESIYLDEASKSIDNELMTFYQSISTPLLVDLALDFGDIEVTDVYPKTLPNIYQGTQLVVTGRYKRGGDTTIKLTGNLNSANQEFPVKASFAEVSKDHLFVSRFWAKAKADDLLLQLQTYGHNQALKDEVIQLSKTYQFATPFTSFIAVSTTPVPQVQQPSQVSKTSSSARYSATLANIQRNPPAKRTIVRQTQAKPLSLWGATGFLPVAAIAVPNFRKAREQARQKACFANMRVIQGAVEMYNMDNNTIMDIVTENELDILVQNKYLKAMPVKPEQACWYGCKGDMSQDGVIVCALHGSVEEPVMENQPGTGPTGEMIYYDPATGNYVTQVSTADVVNSTVPWTTRVWNAYLADAVNLLINVPLFLLGIAFTLWLLYFIIMAPFRILQAIYDMLFVKEDNNSGE